jgi:hypothetical protein
MISPTPTLITLKCILLRMRQIFLSKISTFSTFIPKAKLGYASQERSLPVCRYGELILVLVANLDFWRLQEFVVTVEPIHPRTISKVLSAVEQLIRFGV